MQKKPHIVILGAGFAGLWAMRALTKADVDITIIDRNNYHTFLPLLYQVGAAEIEPEQIAYPVRSLIRNNPRVRFVRDLVSEIDPEKKIIITNGQKIRFDYCLVAAGSVTNFFHTPGAEGLAFQLKSLDDSMVLRNHILTCFERASYSTDQKLRKKLLTVVVVGGGPTGIEFAGALAELVNGAIAKDFKANPLKEIKIVLVESAPKLLPMFSSALGQFTAAKLQALGVEIALGSPVEKLSPAGVHLKGGRLIPSETVLWTAGVKGHPIAAQLKIPLTPAGRIAVEPTLQVPGHPCVYAAGDIVHFEENGRGLPQIAPVAIQQGRWAAGNILRQLAGTAPEPFHYADKGAMVTIGRNAAVAKISRFEFKGFFAWLIWLVIHIMNLIGFRNKLLVLINWAWDYIFFEREVRLILPSCCDNPSSSHCEHRCQ